MRWFSTECAQRLVLVGLTAVLCSSALGRRAQTNSYEFNGSHFHLANSIQAFRHGHNRRWELSGMNPAVLRQEMDHTSALMTARYTGQIPLEQVRAGFSSKLLENMGNSRAVRAVA